MSSKDLAKYLHLRLSTHDKVNTIFHLIKVPTIDELEFYITQYQVKGCVGHSEWSERLQSNIWVSDE